VTAALLANRSGGLVRDDVRTGGEFANEGKSKAATMSSESGETRRSSAAGDTTAATATWAGETTQ